MPPLIPARSGRVRLEYDSGRTMSFVLLVPHGAALMLTVDGISVDWSNPFVQKDQDPVHACRDTEVVGRLDHESTPSKEVDVVSTSRIAPSYNAADSPQLREAARRRRPRPGLRSRRCCFRRRGAVARGVAPLLLLAIGEMTSRGPFRIE